MHPPFLLVSLATVSSGAPYGGGCMPVVMTFAIALTTEGLYNKKGR